MVLGSARTPETILEKTQLRNLAEPLTAKVGCLFKLVRGPRGPRPKFVDRGTLDEKKNAHENKHVAIL